MCLRYATVDFGWLLVTRIKIQQSSHLCWHYNNMSTHSPDAVAEMLWLLVATGAAEYLGAMTLLSAMYSF